MKVQETQQQSQQIKQSAYYSNPEFKGGADVVLRYLATNQAVGANSVDVAFMVTPRTASDFIRRGPNAGFETFRREIMGTVNNSLIGGYGMLAGMFLAIALNNKYGTKANSILAADETVEILAELKSKQLKENSSQSEYVKNILKNMKAFNPDHAGANAEGYVNLSDKAINEISEILTDAISQKDVSVKEWKNDKTPNSLNVIKNKITEDLGAQSKYILEYEADGKTIKSNTELKTLLEDVYTVSQSFEKENVKKAFQDQVSAGKTVKENQFIKKLSRFKKGKSALGILMAALVGASVQPINMYLTKLKTGSDGFVGVEGRTKDDSKGFFALKCATGAAFATMVLKTLDCNLKKIGTLPKQFMDKMAFKGFWPTVNQLKGVYGITIISRLLSARDKDELRESLTKDTLGFITWLILGDYVNKLTADLVDKSVISNTEEVKKENIFKRTFHSTLKTRDEIVIETLGKYDIDTVKKDSNGKYISKTFKEMLKELKTTDKIPEEVKKLTRKRLNALNKAQIAGYLFSGLVLGLGIPNLNIYITNKLDKKRKAEALKKEQEQQNILT